MPLEIRELFKKIFFIRIIKKMIFNDFDHTFQNGLSKNSVL